jgi:hypothetical protein
MCIFKIGSHRRVSILHFFKKQKSMHSIVQGIKDLAIYPIKIITTMKSRPKGGGRYCKTRQEINLLK